MLQSKFLHISLHAVESMIRTIKLHLFPYELLPPALKFARDGWNEKIYRSVPQRNNPSILIFGGYLGDTTQAWLTRFPDAEIDVFEPVSQFAHVLRCRFASGNVTVHENGLSKIQEKRIISLRGDASSTMIRSKRSGNLKSDTELEATFLATSDVIHELPSQVHVIEINIEGGEYELIELLSEYLLLSRAANIFVQFHKIGPMTGQKMEAAVAVLNKSHDLVWEYPFVWSYWKLR